jgi:hypothetical protein
MQVSCEVNTQGLEAACLALAKIPGRSMEEVVTAELGKVIDRTIEQTPAAKVNKIRTRFEASTFTAQPPELYEPATPGGRAHRSRAHLTPKGKLLYSLRNRYPNILWHGIEKRRAESLRRKIGSIGLAKKSWWNIARKLGLPVKGGRFVSALAVTGKEYPENFQTSKSVRETDIAVAFINAQPTAIGAGGARALQTAINGRVKYFLTNVQKGVFDSMDKIARQYPGLKLKQ